MAEGLSTPTPAKRKRKSPNVPGTYAGFSQQTFRAVVHLLNAQMDEVVSVEHLDDIATEGPQRVEVEQTKAGTAKNPIAVACPPSRARHPRITVATNREDDDVQRRRL